MPNVAGHEEIKRAVKSKVSDRAWELLPWWERGTRKDASPLLRGEGDNVAEICRSYVSEPCAAGLGSVAHLRRLEVVLEDPGSPTPDSALMSN